MKHHHLIPLSAALLAVFGAVLVIMTLSDSMPAASSTYSKKYSWYVMPQGAGKQPICADDECFRDDYDVIYLGDDSNKKIWLTFDVGYDNGNTPLILDALAEHDVQAAFFICGNVIDTCPELVCRMAEEGHLVLNHTNKHKDLSAASSEEIEKELCDLEDKYRALTRCDMPKIVRPPEGNYSEACLDTLTDMGYTTMFWSFAYKDWINDEQPSEQKAIDTVLSRAHPGMIALLHSTSATNAAILGRIIDLLEAEGYSFGSFDELLST